MNGSKGMEAAEFEIDRLVKANAALRTRNLELEQEGADIALIAHMQGAEQERDRLRQRIAELVRAESALRWLSMQLGNPCLEGESLEQALVEYAICHIAELEAGSNLRLW